MDRAEALEFVRANNEILAGGFAFDVPRYRFRWDPEAEIILLDIRCRNETHPRTYCLGWDDVSEEGLWQRVHRMLDVYQALYPEWNKYEPKWRDIW